MYEKGVLTIGDYQKGMADSPLFGYETMIGCDIFDTPGVLKMGASTVAETFSALASTDLIIKELICSNGDRISLTESGKLVRNQSVLIASLSKGYDMVEYKGGIFVSYSSGGVGAIGVYNYATQEWWVNKVPTLTGFYYIKLLLGQDDYVYFTNGNLIGRITNSTGMASTVAPTLTYSSNVLDLPDQVYAVTFVELGRNLLIGTQKGGSYSERTNHRVSDIYPWDRNSSSFNLPVRIQENGMQAMTTDGNICYFVAGTSGSVYKTDGTSYIKLRNIPFSTRRAFGSSMQVYPNALAFSTRGTLLIGTSTAADAFPGSTSKHGIYEMSTTAAGYPTALSYICSNGSYGNTQQMYVGHIRTTSTDIIYTSFLDGSTSYHNLTQAARYTNYTSFVESPLIFVGDRLNRKSFSNMTFSFLRPLVSTQGIKISYRKNTTESYTLIGTFDYSSIPGKMSHETKALITDAEILQFKVELTQSVVTAYTNNVELLTLKLW